MITTEFSASSFSIFALVFNDLMIMRGLLRCSFGSLKYGISELQDAIRIFIITVRWLTINSFYSLLKDNGTYSSLYQSMAVGQLWMWNMQSQHNLSELWFQEGLHLHLIMLPYPCLRSWSFCWPKAFLIKWYFLANIFSLSNLLKLFLNGGHLLYLLCLCH